METWKLGSSYMTTCMQKMKMGNVFTFAWESVLMQDWWNNSCYQTWGHIVWHVHKTLQVCFETLTQLTLKKLTKYFKPIEFVQTDFFAKCAQLTSVTDLITRPFNLIFNNTYWGMRKGSYLLLVPSLCSQVDNFKTWTWLSIANIQLYYFICYYYQFYQIHILYMVSFVVGTITRKPLFNFLPFSLPRKSRTWSSPYCVLKIALEQKMFFSPIVRCCTMSSQSPSCIIMSLLVLLCCLC